MENVLQIYGQHSEHADVCVVGDIDSLTRLRDALTEIVDGGRTSSASRSFASDGEGYAVIVIQSTDEEMIRLEDQYEYAEWRDRENKKSPFELLTKERYGELRRWNE